MTISLTRDSQKKRTMVVDVGPVGSGKKLLNFVKISLTAKKYAKLNLINSKII